MKQTSNIYNECIFVLNVEKTLMVHRRLGKIDTHLVNYFQHGSSGFLTLF